MKCISVGKCPNTFKVLNKVHNAKTIFIFNLFIVPFKIHEMLDEMTGQVSHANASRLLQMFYVTSVVPLTLTPKYNTFIF
jgi:hypothetical protein